MELHGIQGVLNAWRKFGAVGFAENLALKILSRLVFGRVERKLILFKELRDLDVPADSDDGFVVRRLVPEDLGEGYDAERLEKESDYYAAIGAFSPAGELAAEGWICFKTFGWRDSDDFGGGRMLAPGDVYFFKAWTKPEYRGRGLHKKILSARFRECSALGFHRAVIRVDGFNRASRRGIERVGFRRVESFFIIKAFGKIRNGMRYGRKN